MECKNCNQELNTTDNYCNDCGARVVNNRLTAKYLGTEFRENFFSIDSNKPLLTFLDLFRKPEAVIDGYMNGVRRKYINPFGYFTLAVTLSSLFYFLSYKFFPGRMEAAYNLISLSKEQAAATSNIQQLTIEYQSLIFFLFIPFFAFITWLLFLNKKKYNFTEHIVLNLYGYSHASIFVVLTYFLAALSSTIFPFVLMFSIFAQMIYYAYLLKRVFHLTFGQLILKTLLFILVGGFIYVGLIIVVMIFMIATGNFDPEMFAPPQ